MHYDFVFRSRRSNVLSKAGMVAAEQPLATLAGLDILRAGGNAADAAIATAAALCVVEPFSTGIGGDCFALYWEAASRKVYALNGSGPAAKRADLNQLLAAGYEHYPLFSGAAVTVPGTVAGWQALLSRFGTMPFSEVLKPAIHHAQAGYPVSELIGHGWAMMPSKLTRSFGDEQDVALHLRHPGPEQPSGHEFLIDGRAPRVGEVMRLPTLAETLQGIAQQGKDYFYQGSFAEALCRHVQAYDGWLEVDDLEGFEAEWVEPIYADYHGYRLFECPPNGQGLAAIMAVKIADGFDLAGMSVVERTHTLIECMRLGFTEALAWVYDPAQNPIPYDQLFDEQYIASRRSLIHPDKALKSLQSGIVETGDDTVYFSVVDGQGNACSFINSLYMGGGTGLVVPGTGVLLQNRGANFSLQPGHPNVLAGSKRPYHTIIPAMLTKDDELFASFGVMGGFMQPQGHLQTLVNMVDLGYNPQQALDMPRFRLEVEGGGLGADQPGGLVHLEEGFSFDEIAQLSKKGHHIMAENGYRRVFFGSGQIITRDDHSGVLTGGSDPRKDGCAMGF